MTRIEIDPADFTPVIGQAVDEALRRYEAELPRDEDGAILVNKEGAGRILDTSEATVDRWRANHGLPFLKLDGGKVWFRVEALREWAAAREMVQ